MPHKDPEARRAYARAYNARIKAEDPERQAKIAAQKAASYKKRITEDEKYAEKRREDYRRWYALHGKENARERKGHIPLEEYLEKQIAKRKAKSKYMTEYAKTEKGRRNQLNSSLMHSFKMSVDDYDVLYDKQEGKCRICGVFKERYLSDRQGLFVDHCHRSGKIRGLLCRNCNSGIGLFLDNKDSLLRAIEYLKEHSEDTENVDGK